jgi:chromosome segregation protein
VAIPTDAGGMEAHLYNLERQRDAIGPVNLRAEDEATEHCPAGWRPCRPSAAT